MDYSISDPKGKIVESFYVQIFIFMLGSHDFDLQSGKMLMRFATITSDVTIISSLSVCVYSLSPPRCLD